MSKQRAIEELRSQGAPRYASKRPATDLEMEILQFVFDHITVTTEHIARKLKISSDRANGVIDDMFAAGWVKRLQLKGFDTDWVQLRGGGTVKLGSTISSVRRGSDQARHRYGIVEARLRLEEEFPGGKWTPERELAGRCGSTSIVPDGVFMVGDSRWAIEVELSRKSYSRVEAALHAREEVYDKVIYFCSERVISILSGLERTSSFPRLEIRELRALSGVEPRSKRAAPITYTPTKYECGLLSLICEEGLLREDHLSALAEGNPSNLKRALRNLESKRCVRRLDGVPGTEQWLWCSSIRASRFSGTGLPRFQASGEAELQRRVKLMEARLWLRCSDDFEKWVTHRILAKGKGRAVSGLPHAAVRINRREYAVYALVGKSLPGFLERRFEKWSDVYDGILCFTDPAGLSAVKSAIARAGLSKAVVVLPEDMESSCPGV